TFRVEMPARGPGRRGLAVDLLRAAVGLLVHMESMHAGRQPLELRREDEAVGRLGDDDPADIGAHAYIGDEVHDDEGLRPRGRQRCQAEQGEGEEQENGFLHRRLHCWDACGKSCARAHGASRHPAMALSPAVSTTSAAPIVSTWLTEPSHCAAAANTAGSTPMPR